MCNLNQRTIVRAVLAEDAAGQIRETEKFLFEEPEKIDTVRKRAT
jgi:hypothetical protein